jgi:hypothetical protein
LLSYGFELKDRNLEFFLLQLPCSGFCGYLEFACVGDMTFDSGIYNGLVSDSRCVSSRTFHGSLLYLCCTTVLNNHIMVFNFVFHYVAVAVSLVQFFWRCGQTCGDPVIVPANNLQFFVVKSLVRSTHIEL